MEKKANVLASALTLKEFTVAELARFSGVNRSTVNSVIRRNRDLFVRTRDDASERKRGGQSFRYRVSKDKSVELERQIQSLRELPLVPAKPEAERQEGSNEIERNCLAAVYEILDAFPADVPPTDESQRRQIKRGLLLLRTADNLFKAVEPSGLTSDTDLETLGAIVKLAQDFAELGRVVRRRKNSNEFDFDSLSQLIDIQSALSRRLLKILVAQHAHSILKRVATLVGSSELLQMDFVGRLALEAVSTVPPANANQDWLVDILSRVPFALVPSSVDSDEVSIVNRSNMMSDPLGTFSTKDLPPAAACMVAELIERINPPSLSSILH